uniref:Uncharacterized protein n=1 Tax=viral metagenome TaxID=1070528 RepID=A0A6H1ZVB5_9ZZZZ
MALITSAEVKVLLSIPTATTTWDTLIANMIIIINEWLPNYLNNYFTDPNLYIESANISFTGTTILDSESSFVTEGFVTGMDIYVFGSLHNDGFHLITTASAGTLTCTGSAFITEAAGDSTPRINRVKYPVSLKPSIANIIKFQIDQEKQGLGTERIGDYTVGYGDGYNFPKSIVKTLGIYKKVGF